MIQFTSIVLIYKQINVKEKLTTSSCLIQLECIRRYLATFRH